LENNLDILRPAMIRRSVTDIDFRELHSYGLTKILFDLDGTLAANMSNKYDENVIHHILEAKANLWIEDVCVLSNCGVWFLEKRVERFANLLNAKYHACKWPNPMKPDVAALMPALDKIGGTDKNAVMIGDQLEKDILGGNSLDIHTIFVETIGPIPIWKRWQHEKQLELMKEMNITFPN